LLALGITCTAWFTYMPFVAWGLDPALNDSPASYHWDLLNGSIQLNEPIRLQFRDRQSGEERSVSLTKPQIVGAGSGGAVLAFDQQTRDVSLEGGLFSQRDLLLKISWEGTAKTVQRECDTLQLLEDRHVETAERCLGSFPYYYTDATMTQQDTKPRTMILVAPYMRDAVASVAEVDTEAARMNAVVQIARTLVQMLTANVITIDVQPLISKATGQTIFIDMTEAQVLSSSQGSEYSFLDQTLISSFTSEMVALIPENYWKVAKTAILDEIDHQRKLHGGEFSERVQAVLEDQTSFLMDD